MTAISGSAHHSKIKDSAIILFIGLIIFLAITAFQGKILFEEDVAYYYMPAFKFYSEAVKNNQDFSIAPGIFSGFPLYLSQVGGFYEPLNFFIFKYLPFPLAYNFRIFLNYWLSAIFTYLFIKELNLGRMAALIGAFSYITAQNFVPGMNILRSNSFFVMPGLFYILMRLRPDDISARSRIFFILLGSAIFSLGFLGGYTQLVLYSVVAVFLFFVYLNLTKLSWKFIFSASLSFLLGALIFLPQLLKVLEYMPFTGRAGGLSWDVASQSGEWSLESGGVLKNIFLPPIASGTLQSLYIGSLSPIFFLNAFFIRKNKSVYFFIIIFLFSLLSSFPYPFFWAMHFLPIFKYFRFPPHWLAVSSFAMSILAAFGYAHAARANEFFRNLNKKFIHVLNENVPIADVIIGGILILNFLIPAWFLANYNTFDADIFFKNPPIVEKINDLEKDPPAFRVFNFYPRDFLWFLLVKPFDPSPLMKLQFEHEYVQTHLSPLAWGLSSIRGFDYFVPRRYLKALSYLDEKELKSVLSTGDIVSINDDGEIDSELKVDPQILNVLGMMNVKYLYSIVPLAQDSDDIDLIDKVIFTPEEKPYSIQTYLYKNNRFLPRIFIPKRIDLMKEDENNFDKIFKIGYDFKEIGFIECAECGGFANIIHQSVPQLEVTSLENDALTFSYVNEQDAWVIISNSFVPGWKAFIDGLETKIYYANYIYQGIKVPKGGHIIELKYK